MGHIGFLHFESNGEPILKRGSTLTISTKRRVNHGGPTAFGNRLSFGGIHFVHQCHLRIPRFGHLLIAHGEHISPDFPRLRILTVLHPQGVLAFRNRLQWDLQKALATGVKRLVWQ